MAKLVADPDPDRDASSADLRREIKRRKQRAPVGGPGAQSATVSRGEQLSRARSAVARAISKNDVARGWPAFLRGIRRNQEALNEAMIDALSSLVKSNQWLRDRLETAERRLEELERERVGRK